MLENQSHLTSWNFCNVNGIWAIKQLQCRY